MGTPHAIYSLLLYRDYMIWQPNGYKQYYLHYWTSRGCWLQLGCCPSICLLLYWRFAYINNAEGVTSSSFS